MNSNIKLKKSSQEEKKIKERKLRICQRGTIPNRVPAKKTNEVKLSNK